MKMRQISKGEIAEYIVDLEDAIERKLTDEESLVCAEDYMFLRQFDEAGLEEIASTLEGQLQRIRADLQEEKDVDKLRSTAGQVVRMLQLLLFRVQIILLAQEQEAPRIIIPGHGGLS